MKISPLVLFVALVLCLTSICLVFPINLFDGEFTRQIGLQEITEQAPLSLSYFVGLGLNEGDLDNIVEFHLLPKGWFMVIVFLVGIPGLLSYRVHLRNKKNEEH